MFISGYLEWLLWILGQNMQHKRVWGKKFYCPNPVQGDLSLPSSPFPTPPSAQRDTSAYWECSGSFAASSADTPWLSSWSRSPEQGLLQDQAQHLHSLPVPLLKQSAALLILLYFSLSMAQIIAGELNASFLAMPHLYSVVLVRGG